MAPKVVTLRAPIEADIAVHAARPVSAEIHRLYGGRGAPMVPNRAHSKDWYAWLCAQPIGRIITLNDQAVGEIRLHTVSEVDQSARLALGLFEERWLGQGIGRAAIRQILAIGFDDLGLHRIELAVLAFNSRAIRCYRACGFQHDGTLREAVRLQDGWHDEWIMSCLSHEYAKTKNDKSSETGKPLAGLHT